MIVTRTSRARRLHVDARAGAGLAAARSARAQEGDQAPLQAETRDQEARRDTKQVSICCKIVPAVFCMGNVTNIILYNGCLLAFP